MSVHLRVSDDQVERWRAAASSSGVSLADFIRSGIDARIRDSGPRAAARVVANELLPQIERMLDERLGNGSSQAPNAGQPVQAFAMSRAFERGCIDADLHVSGQRCASCGGSFWERG